MSSEVDRDGDVSAIMHAITSRPRVWSRYDCMHLAPCGAVPPRSAERRRRLPAPVPCRGGVTASAFTFLSILSCVLCRASCRL